MSGFFRGVGRQMRHRRWAITAVGLLAGIAAASSVTVAPAAEQGGGAAADSTLSAGSGVTNPESSVAPGAPQSAAERERAFKGVLANREAAARQVSGGQPRGGDNSAPTGLTDPDVSELPSVVRNSRNTRAQAVSSTLAEPAAANDGTEVMYTGNTYFSRSADSGATWLADSIPGGPTATPIACCDGDVVHKPSLDTTFATYLYVNNANPPTDGALRIFVRKGTIAGGNDCTYTLPTTGSVVPDYPHIAVSNNYLYLTWNNLTSGSSWTAAVIRRYNVSQLSNCVTASFNQINYTGSDGQRILTPVENATTTMYFGLNRSANTFRIIRWPESSTSATQFDRTLSHGSAFVNPDCRGGTGNFDFIQRSTSWSIGGFRLRGAVVPGSRVWFSWNVGPDGSHPQGHVHSAVFSDSTSPSLLATPHIHNSSLCFGYPTLGANVDGFFGLTIAAGGKSGGGGAAAQGYIGVDDNSTAGHAFGNVVLTASGTHNRSDGRYGDYFTVRKDDACFRRWVATNYALSGGNTSSSHVNARYVVFRSNNNTTC